MVEKMLGICVRFDLVKRLGGTDSDRIGYVIAILPQVPNVGEAVNLNGDLFIVINRGWAVGQEDDPFSLYAYLRVMAAPRIN